MLNRILRTKNLICINRRYGVSDVVNRYSFSCRRLSSSFQPFVGSAENEADMFGTIERSFDEKVASNFDFIEDDHDAQDEHEAKIADIYRPGKSHFLRKINDLVHNKKDLKCALDVLETEMKEQLVQPEQAHYRVLINGCAKAGHTNKAFQLYREFKERGLKRHVGIYADLFASCTRSHDRLLGLEKATGLLNELREKHINPSRVLYNSMIQAFGRCGDLKTAFNLVDEMKEQKFSLNSETFNFLLQGCLSDKENGFRHALIVWRNMRRKRIRPDIHTYNLVIRCANDCKLGDFSQVQDILLESLPLKERVTFQKRLEASVVEKAIEEGGSPEINWLDIDLSAYQTMPATVTPNGAISRSTSVPSLLEASPNLDNVISLQLADTPNNRLLLLGGPESVISVMSGDDVTADLKTISLLLINNNTVQHEQEVMELMVSLNMTPDIAFFNQLIKQRALRRDYEAGISTLAEIAKHSLSPDILTFGALAMCCSTRKSGLKLLSDMHKYGAKPNTEIMGALITGATKRFSPGDVKVYLEIAKLENILINKKIINDLEWFYKTFRNHIKTKEEGGYVPYPVMQDYKRDYKNWRAFTQTYKEWLNEIKLEETSDPMEQYTTIKDKRQHKLETKCKERDAHQMRTSKRKEFNYKVNPRDDEMEGFSR